MFLPVLQEASQVSLPSLNLLLAMMAQLYLMELVEAVSTIRGTVHFDWILFYLNMKIYHDAGT